MKDQKEVKYGGPKYKSQLKVFERMIVVFEKAINERELLLSNQNSHENKEKIKAWNSNDLDKLLLPKTVS